MLIRRVDAAMPNAVRPFISYSHEDATFVARLKADLQRADADLWIDHERLQPGTHNWQLAIREGIEKADLVIYVASPAAARSPFVVDEIGLARSIGRRVIPLWANGTSWHDAAPLGWGSTQYIDARSPRYADAFDELRRAIGLVMPSPSKRRVRVTRQIVIDGQVVEEIGAEEVVGPDADPEPVRARLQEDVRRMAEARARELRGQR